MVIDLHSHYFPAQAVRLCPEAGLELEPLSAGGYRFTALGKAAALPGRLFDVEAQVLDMFRQGLGGRVLAVPPFCFLYELPAEVGTKWCRALNDGIARAAQTRPGVLFGMATVPLQDVGEAVRELERAVLELGLVGVEIATSVAGIELDHPMFQPFWARAQALDVPVLIHPHYTSDHERMTDYYLRTLIGHPFETALAASRLIFGGVLERSPRLRILLVQGGGGLPHLAGRLEVAYRTRPECRTTNKRPGFWLKKMYFDTAVYAPAALRGLVDMVGATQLVVGTDYPFELAEEQPVEFVMGAGLLLEESDLILRGGGRLLGSRARYPRGKK